MQHRTILGICRVALLAVLAAGLALAIPDTTNAASLNEIKKLTASDAEADDEFGYTVAVSGDTTVVGARVEDAGGIFAGAAYVFQRDQGGADNWGEVTKLTASDAETSDQFGYSVALSGNTAIVGARFEAAGGASAGAAYVFQRDLGGTDNWGETKKLIASDAEANDFFGVSVSVSDDVAVVGAFGVDSGSGSEGAAYEFRRDQGGADNWGEVKKLTATDAGAGDNLGISVAVSGGIAVSGALFEDAGGTDAGAAYVFELLLSKPTPTPKATFTPTITPTPSRTPDPVGGIALDAGLRSLPLETNSADSAPWGIALAIAMAASLGGLGGAAWYARRRWHA